MMIMIAPYMGLAVNYFIVTYYPNAPGSQSPMIDTAAIGYLYSIKFNLYSNPGYTFNGWNSKPDGMGVPYSPGMSIKVSADLIMYAQWRSILPERVKITYKANAKDSQANVTDLVNKGSSYALKANLFARAGYTLAGWNTQASGSGSVFSPSQVITANGDLTLYAKWDLTAPESVTISYRANAHDCQADINDTVIKGSAYALRANPFTRYDYVFTGWNTQANGFGNALKPEQIVTANNSGTLYAQWKVVVVETVTITYKANANDSQSDVKDTVTKGSSFALRANPFTRSGFDFTGWNTKPDNTGNSFKPGQTFTPNAYQILYAQWKAADSAVKDKPK